MPILAKNMAPGMLNARSHVATENFRPRSVEDTVDAGVHPLVAKMRLSTLELAPEKTMIYDGIDMNASPWMRSAQNHEAGYTYRRKNGLITSLGTQYTNETKPLSQVSRMVDAGSANPADFFKQSTKLGINPMNEVLGLTKSGPGLPSRRDRADGKDQSSSSSSSSSSSGDKKKKKKKVKKDKKNKKDKKSKKHKKKKGKSDKKKKASSSSEADEGNSQPANRNILPPQMVGATIELDSDDGRPDACAETKELQLTGAGTMDVDKPEHKAAASRDVPSVGMPDSSPEDTGVPRCPKGHTLAKLAIGLATSGHNSHTCDKCKVRSKVSGAKEIYRCKACNFDMCVRCYARLLVLGEDADCSQASEKERAKLKVTGDDVLNEGEPAGAAVSDPYECPGLEEPAAKVRKVTDDDDTNLKVLLAKKKSEQKKLKKKEPVMPDIPDPSEAYAAYRKGPRGAPGGSFAGDY